MSEQQKETAGRRTRPPGGRDHSLSRGARYAIFILAGLDILLMIITRLTVSLGTANVLIIGSIGAFVIGALLLIGRLLHGPGDLAEEE